MLFLGIISWKAASHFNGAGAGGGEGSDGGASFLSGGCIPWRASVLMGEFLKIIVG